MTVSLWQDRSDAESLETEILVVGAGITGASAAYWLARAGFSAMVVDGRDVADGASGRSGGMLLLGTADPYARVVDLLGRDRAKEVWEFTAINRALLTEHVLEGAGDDALRLVRTGTASASISEHEQLELERSHALLREDGFEMNLLDAGEVSEAVAARGLHGALVDPAGMTVDPARLTRRILDLAAEAGATFRPHHEVFDFEETGDGVVVRTSRATIHAQMVLLCTNAFSPLASVGYLRRLRVRVLVAAAHRTDRRRRLAAACVRRREGL
jgi:glycine/D-amino acid oxidase-like deaminating enzyme